MLNRETVWRGAVARLDNRPDAFVVRLPHPLPATGRLHVRLDVGGRSFETSTGAERNRFLLVLCFGSRQEIGALWTDEPRAE